MIRLMSRRWLTVVMRSAHIAAVMLLGAALHGAPLSIPVPILAALTAGSGAVMFGLDLYSRRDHWREIAGIGVMIKILLIGSLSFSHGLELIVFWTVLLWSAVLSHAPATFRHHLVLH